MINQEVELEIIYDISEYKKSGGIQKWTKLPILQRTIIGISPLICMDLGNAVIWQWEI